MRNKFGYWVPGSRSYTLPNSNENMNVLYIYLVNASLGSSTRRPRHHWWSQDFQQEQELVQILGIVSVRLVIVVRMFLA